MSPRAPFLPILLLASLLAPLLFLGGCQSTSPLPETWQGATELTSEHFDLETDIPPELAPFALQRAEEIHGELSSTLGLGHDDSRIRLLVFADQYDFGRYHGVDLPSREQLARERAVLEEAGYEVLGTWIETPAGHYRRNAFGQEEVAVFYQDRLEGALRHELAHVLLRRHLPRPPAWLDEGLAEYLRFRHDGRERGRALEQARSMVESGKAVEPAELVQWSHRKLYQDPTQYVIAWLLVEAVEREGRLDLRRPGSLVQAGADLAPRVTLQELVESTR